MKPLYLFAFALFVVTSSLSASAQQTEYRIDSMECTSTLLSATGDADGEVEYSMRGDCTVYGAWHVPTGEYFETGGEGQIGQFRVITMDGSYDRETGRVTEGVLATEGYRAGYIARWVCSQDPWLYQGDSNSICDLIEIDHGQNVGHSGGRANGGSAMAQRTIGPALGGSLNAAEVQDMLANQTVSVVLMNLASGDITGPWNTTLGRANLQQTGSEVLGTLMGEDDTFYLVQGTHVGDAVNLTLSVNGQALRTIEVGPRDDGSYAGSYRSAQGGSGLASIFSMSRPLFVAHMQTNQPSPQAEDIASCNVAGTWEHTTNSIGTSRWVLSPGSNGAWDAVEDGLGGARGRATVNGSTLRIEWNAGDWSGYYSWSLSNACDEGSGQLVFTSGGSGSHSSTVRRVD